MATPCKDMLMWVIFKNILKLAQQTVNNLGGDVIMSLTNSWWVGISCHWKDYAHILDWFGYLSDIILIQIVYTKNIFLIWFLDSFP